MIYLFIDDLRDYRDYIPEDADGVLIAKTYDEAVDLLSIKGLIDIVYFDHDLGEEKTGYDIAKYIVENSVYLYGFKIHSANPVGRFNISQLLTHYGYQELS